MADIVAAFAALELPRELKRVAAASLERDGGGSGAFSVRAGFELPDGGRFILAVSGDDVAGKGAGPLMLLVLDDVGLIAGLLDDINTFLLESEAPAGDAPATLLTNALQRMVLLFNKAVRRGQAKSSLKTNGGDAGLGDGIDGVRETKKRELPVLPSPTAKPVFEAPEFGSTTLATTTLMKQLRLLEEQNTKQEGFVAEPKEDDLYTWRVLLYFDDSVKIGRELASLPSHDAVELEFRFPAHYPSEPPIVRCVAPAICGGHVMGHGGICMELLTGAGWSPVNSIDLVCIQIRAMLIQGSASIDLRNPNSHVDRYTFDGAMRDLRSIVMQHRWTLENARVAKRPRNSQS